MAVFKDKCINEDFVWLILVLFTNWKYVTLQQQIFIIDLCICPESRKPLYTCKRKMPISALNL